MAGTVIAPDGDRVGEAVPVGRAVRRAGATAEERHGQVVWYSTACASPTTGTAWFERGVPHLLTR